MLHVLFPTFLDLWWRCLFNSPLIILMDLLYIFSNVAISSPCTVADRNWAQRLYCNYITTKCRDIITCLVLSPFLGNYPKSGMFNVAWAAYKKYDWNSFRNNFRKAQLQKMSLTSLVNEHICWRRRQEFSQGQCIFCLCNARVQPASCDSCASGPGSPSGLPCRRAPAQLGRASQRSPPHPSRTGRVTWAPQHWEGRGGGWEVSWRLVLGFLLVQGRWVSVYQMWSSFSFFSFFSWQVQCIHLDSILLFSLFILVGCPSISWAVSHGCAHSKGKLIDTSYSNTVCSPCWWQCCSESSCLFDYPP